MAGMEMAGLRAWMRRDHRALLPIRWMVGFGFAAHGYAKLARGPAGFAPILAALGFPAPLFTAWVTSIVEFAGGILLMLGAFVLPLSFAFASIMAVAMFGVHLRYGFSSIRLMSLTGAEARFGPVGYELNLLYVAAIATLALSGSTPLSLDRWLEERGRRSRGRAPALTEAPQGRSA